MKLILTAPVDNLGAAGDVVEVKDGYGRNFLLPRNLAIQATRGAQRQIDGIKRVQESRQIRDLDHATEVKGRLEGLTDVKLSVKTSDTGKLFGSVSAADVVAAIRAAGGPNIDKRTVELPKSHIKDLGKHVVTVKLHPEVAATVDVAVVAA